MEGQRYSRAAIVVFVSSGISFVMILIHEAVRYLAGSPIMVIDWAANVLIVVTSFYLRSHVDEEKHHQAVMESIPEGKPINPSRFINCMPVAMVVGLAAEITIRYNFIAGMLLYLAMQVLLIYTFSGILPFGFRNFRSGESSGSYRAVTALGTLVPAVLFYIFIYNGLKTLVVIPYICFLSVMTIVTYLAFTRKARPMMFRLAPAIASTSFFASDLLVGYVAFNNPVSKFYFIISVTYIIAVLLFNMSIVFLKTGKGVHVVS